jgi:hypothetical protein
MTILYGMKFNIAQRAMSLELYFAFKDLENRLFMLMTIAML